MIINKSITAKTLFAEGERGFNFTIKLRAEQCSACACLSNAALLFYLLFISLLPAK